MGQSLAHRAIVLSAAMALSLTAGTGTAASQAPAATRAKSQPAKPLPAGPATARPAEPNPSEPVNAKARALADVRSRIAEYVVLHKKLEDTIFRLSKDATPEEIDKHHRALAHLLQQARRGAKPGDIFAPAATAVIRQLMDRVFGGPDGASLRASIMDENPGSMKITINAAYPDSVPLATMPPQVLEGLPRLPEELEYRFLGDRLILMDVHAQIIVDLIDNALGPH